MGIFGSSKSSKAPQQAAPAAPESIKIPDPGLDPEDPRQTWYQLVEGAGLAFVVIARQPVEATLSMLVNAVPALARSEALANGVQKLTWQPMVLWVAMDGPQGSAVVIACGDIDGMSLTQQLVSKLRELPAPLEWAICSTGSVRADFVPIVAAGDIVPVTDWPPFDRLRTDSGYDVLPARFHRAAAGWNRVAYCLYEKRFRTPRGDEVMVFAGLGDSPSVPAVKIRVDVQTPDQVQRIRSALAGGPYRLQPVDGFDFLAFGTRTPVDMEHPDHLDTEAARLVSAWWNTVAPVFGWTAPVQPGPVQPGPSRGLGPARAQAQPPRPGPALTSRPAAPPERPASVGRPAVKEIAPRASLQPQTGVALSKGGNVSLTKAVPGLAAVTIGLGWDAAGAGTPVDLDASALALGANRRVPSDAHIIFYNNLRSPDGAIVHEGDNRTGVGDDERISVRLTAVSTQVDAIVFVVSIHDAEARRHSFGDVENAYIRVVDDASGAELTRFDLTHDVGAETAMLFGELYRRGSEWKFRAVGQGYASGLAGVAADFGVGV